MLPIAHIRKNVLKVSQAKFAEIARVNQATVSRWENGEFDPGLNEMSLIRSEASARLLEWDDAWFFGVPAAHRASAGEATAA